VQNTITLKRSRNCKKSVKELILIHVTQREVSDTLKRPNWVKMSLFLIEFRDIFNRLSPPLVRGVITQEITVVLQKSEFSNERKKGKIYPIPDRPGKSNIRSQIPPSNTQYSTKIKFEVQ
jgi:hypothetical protein